jgi:hypothetical protein
MTETTVPGSRAPSRTGLIIGIASGAVLLILVVIGAVVFALQSAAHTPQRAVDAYLQAIVHANVTRALSLGGVKATPSDRLLTDAAYRAATDHITGYSLSGAVTNGDGAAVTAEITQGTERYRQSFALVKHGKDMLFFDHWQLKPVALGRATVDVNAPSDAKVSVAGVVLDDASGVHSLLALPGTYQVKITGTNDLYQAKTTSAQVIGFSGAASTAARVTATLTDAGMKSAIAAVNTYIDGCAASTDFRPAGCSFGSTGENPAYTYSNQKWTIDPRPQFTIGTWVAGGWAVRTTTPGVARFSADISDGEGGSGTATAGPVDVRVAGYISKIDASGATFESLIAEPATA